MYINYKLLVIIYLNKVHSMTLITSIENSKDLRKYLLVSSEIGSHLQKEIDLQVTDDKTDYVCLGLKEPGSDSVAEMFESLTSVREEEKTVLSNKLNNIFYEASKIRSKESATEIRTYTSFLLHQTTMC